MPLLSFITRHWFRGQLRLSPPGSRCLVTPPASSDGWISLQVRSLLPSCCQHVKELCLCPQGGLALTISPGHGRHCSCATAVDLIARGHEVAKLRNVLRCLLHPYDAVFGFELAVHELAVVEFRAPNMGISVSLGKCSPGGALIVEDVLCHVSLIVHD